MGIRPRGWKRTTRLLGPAAFVASAWFAGCALVVEPGAHAPDAAAVRRDVLVFRDTVAAPDAPPRPDVGFVRDAADAWSDAADAVDARPTDVVLPPLLGVVQVALSERSSAALLSDGSVRWWDGRGLHRADVPDGVTEISGGTSICALRAGAVWCELAADTPPVFANAGVVSLDHASGCQLFSNGLDSCLDGLPPLPPFVQVTASRCAVLVDGTARCWGENSVGQVGIGMATRAPVLTPTEVVGLRDVVEIAAGSSHTCARLRDSTARCWGENTVNQLGDGTRLERDAPVEVVGLRDATQLAAGRYHTCALRTDGTVWCWGDNDRGNLGDGTREPRYTPSQVPGLAEITQIAIGAIHTCALRRDSTVWCWGENDNGQLGDGTATPRFSPVQVRVY